MERINITFSDGFFENLSTYRQLQKAEQEEMEQRSIQKQKIQEPRQPLFPLPLPLPVPIPSQQPQQINVQKETKNEIKIKELTKEVDSLKEELQALYGSYLDLVDRGVAAQRDILENIETNSKVNNLRKIYMEGSPCFIEYNDLHQCIKESESISHSDASTAIYMLNKMCLGERLMYRICAHGTAGHESTSSGSGLLSRLATKYTE